MIVENPPIGTVGILFVLFEWKEKKKKPFAKVNAQMRFGCIKMANVPDHTAYVRFDTTTGVQVHLLLQRGQWVRK